MESTSIKNPKQDPLHFLKQNQWSDSILKLHPKMKDIVQKDKDKDSRFLCKICKIHNSSLKPQNLRSLISHFFCGNHLKHMKKENLTDVNQEICKIFREEPKAFQSKDNIDLNLGSDSRGHEENGEKGFKDDTWLKFELTKFIVSNRMPYSIIENLLEFIKNLILNYEEETLLLCSASRKLITEISRECIGKSLQEEILDHLKDSPFFLMIDKGSDYYGKAYLTVCVKYLEKDNYKYPVTKLLSIIEMGEKATSEELYKLIKEKILSKHELISKNLMAIVTDGESTMTGKHQGLSTRLQSDFDHLLAVKDLSHIYNLVCQKAIKEYKGEVIKMVKYVSSHFSRSPLRVALLERIQKEKGRTNFLHVIPYTKVRWLSLTQSLERILKIWEDLEIYFTEIKDEGLDYFTDKNQCHAQCLFILLSQLTHYNKEFQRNDLNLNDVISTMRESFIVFAREVLPKDFEKSSFEQLFSIPFNSSNPQDQKMTLNETQFKDKFIKDYSGVISVNLNSEARDNLFGIIKKFILKILCEMKERLPLNEQIFKECRVVFFEEWDIDSWRWLAEKFHNIIGPEESTQFQHELKRMSIHFSSLKKQHESSNRTILESWENISPQYPYVSKLARSVLVLSYSSVPVERIFSQMQDFKTEKRSRLTTENLETSLLTYQAFDHLEFIISNDMMERYKNLWKKETLQTNEVQSSKPREEDEAKTSELKTKEKKKFILVEVNSESDDEMQTKTKKKVLQRQSQSLEPEIIS